MAFHRRFLAATPSLEIRIRDLSGCVLRARPGGIVKRSAILGISSWLRRRGMTAPGYAVPILDDKAVRMIGRQGFLLTLAERG